MPKVSIIVPVYNAEPYLARCIESILRQTYKDFELILVNDGSSDNSLDLCNSYQDSDSRIVVLDGPNFGVSRTRNRGIGQSRGNFVTFVDADDWLEDDALEVMLSAIEAKDVDCVRSSYFLDDGRGREVVKNLKVRSGLYKNAELNELFLQFAKGIEPCYTPLLMVRRRLLEEVLFDDNLRLLEDKVFYLSVLKKIHTIYLLDVPTYHYFYNSQSASRSTKKSKENVINVVRAHDAILKVSQYLDMNTLRIIRSDHLYILRSNLYNIFENEPMMLAQNLDWLNKQPEYGNFVREFVPTLNIKGCLQRVFMRSTQSNTKFFMYLVFYITRTLKR